MFIWIFKKCPKKILLGLYRPKTSRLDHTLSSLWSDVVDRPISKQRWSRAYNWANVCVECADKLDIVFNATKSTIFKVGKVSQEKLDNLYLGKNLICWCNCLKYLGMHFLSDQCLKVDINPPVRKCYASAKCNLCKSFIHHNNGSTATIKTTNSVKHN